MENRKESIQKIIFGRAIDLDCALIDLEHSSLKASIAFKSLSTVAAPHAKAVFCQDNYPELFDHCMINGIFCETTFNENALILDHFLSEDESDESNGPGIEE